MSLLFCWTNHIALFWFYCIITFIFIWFQYYSTYTISLHIPIYVFFSCLICLLLFPVKLNNDIIMTPRSDNICEINPVKESWTVVVWIVLAWFLSPFQHSVIKFEIISKNNVSSLFSKYHIFVLGSWLTVVYNILKSIILFLILFLSLYSFRVFCLFLCSIFRLL